jgi:hypothetical protein
MPGIARQFEPQITRSGGAPSKFRFTIRCSECASADTYETSRPTSNDTVKGYFNERGWLLGRAPSFDVCSVCLARPHHTPAMKSTAPRREARASDKRHQETADILARHLGKPEELAAEVFRPKEAKPPQSSAPKVPQPTHPTPTLSPEVEQALTEMAADLKGLRSAVELIAEQVSKLVTLEGQQIEGIARLAPLVVQSAEGISGSVREVVTAVQTLSPLSATPLTQSVSADEAHQERHQDVSSDPALVQAPDAPVKRTRRSGKIEGPARKVVSAQAVVKSIPDAKRPDRFYTTIRLPRELWDRAGFGPEDRIQIDWKKKVLSITRVVDGGVKPKSIGDAVVVLQSWRLGDLTFDPAKVTAGDGTLRLTLP